MPSFTAATTTESASPRYLPSAAGTTRPGVTADGNPMMMSHRRFMKLTALVAIAAAAVSAASTSSSSSSTFSSARMISFANGAITSDLDIDNDESYGDRLERQAIHGKTNNKDEADELDLDDEYSSGIDALLARDDDEEEADEFDYTTKDDDEDEDDDDDGDSKKKKAMRRQNGQGRSSSRSNSKKKASSSSRRSRRASKNDGVLPQLAEQSEKIAEQSRQLHENSEMFKKDVAEMIPLPKKLLETSARLVALAKLPSYASSKLMFNTQAKELKKQSGRIQDIVTQLMDRIPQYAKEAENLSVQADGIKDVADQNMLQGLESEDPSVVELRQEVKKLQKEYARTLRKSDELRKSLKQLREQADSVNQIAANLPMDSTPAAADEPIVKKPKKRLAKKPKTASL